MKPLRIDPLAGRILISVPFLQDFYFRRSVVLLADHSEEGSFGLIINKPVDVKLSDISDEFEGFEAPVFMGGPVKTDSLFFIHTRPDLIDESAEIMDGLYWGGNIDTVRNLIKQHALLQSEIRFFVGYAGWSPNQLNKELEENSWVVSLADFNQIIGSNPRDLWTMTLKKLGHEYSLWDKYPADPSLN